MFGAHSLWQKLSLGVQLKPLIGVHIDALVLWDLAVGARAVKAGRGCGDGANAVHGLIEVSALESPTVVARLDDVTG